MKKYKYYAINADSKIEQGTLQAKNTKEALQFLQEQRLLIIKLQGEHKIKELIGVRKGVAKQLEIDFCYQMSVMLGAGVSISEGISTFIDNQDSKNKEIFHGMLDSLNKGYSLAQSMKELGIFHEFSIAMARAGEFSGDLAASLQEAVFFLQREASLRQKLQSAMLYPLFLMIIGICVMVFILCSLLPTLEIIYSSYQMELPVYTACLLALGGFMQENELLLFLVLGILIFISWTVKKYSLFMQIRYRLLLAMPFIGDLHLLSSRAIFLSALASLLKSGLGADEGLMTAAGLFKNAFFRNSYERAVASVNQGQSLSKGLERTRMFSKMEITMLQAGEKAGELILVLRYISKACLEEWDLRAEKFKTLLEPMILLFLGLLTGLIAISTLVPVFDLITIIQ